MESRESGRVPLQHSNTGANFMLVLQQGSKASIVRTQFSAMIPYTLSLWSRGVRMACHKQNTTALILLLLRCVPADNAGGLRVCTIIPGTVCMYVLHSPTYSLPLHIIRDSKKYCLTGLPSTPNRYPRVFGGYRI